MNALVNSLQYSERIEAGRQIKRFVEIHDRYFVFLLHRQVLLEQKQITPQHLNQMNIAKISIGKSDKITILALSWRDIESPNKGGAEVQTHAMLSALPRDKYRIIHLSALYESMNEETEIDGIRYYRAGNVFSVIFLAYVFYQHNKSFVDLIIDQCNTHRFFTPMYIAREKRIFYIHQMTKEIWRINLPFVFGAIGEAVEGRITKMYRKGYTITVSESTKRNLIELGFDPQKIFIFPQNLKNESNEEFNKNQKYTNPTFVYVGRYSPYKGIDVAVEALGLAKQKMPQAQLHILGKYDDEYVENKLKPICQKYSMSIGKAANDITYDVICDGFVSEETKKSILARSHALVFPSIREGWGIPVSEAAYVCTPSIVFDSDGLRDAVDYGRAGYITEQNTAEGLSHKMILVIENKEEYEQMREAAYQFTKEYLEKDYTQQLDDLLSSLV